MGQFSPLPAALLDNAATNAKLADVPTATIKGRVTAGTGDPEDLTATQVTTIPNLVTSALKGLAPASGGGTTNFLRADATWAAPAGGSGGDSGPLQKTRRVVFEEFDQSSTNLGFLIAFNLGTGASGIVAIDAVANQIGVRGLTTGTDATGRSTLFTGNSVVFPGFGEIIWENNLRVPVLSTAAEEFTVRCGLMDTTTGNGTAGAFFRYDRPVSPNWQAVTRVGSVETSVITTVAVATTGFPVFRVTVNSACTSIAFAINGTTVATITTNLPASNNVGMGLGIIKSVGLLAREIYTDFAWYETTFATPR